MNFRERIEPYAGWEMFLMRLFLLWPCWKLVRRIVVAVQPQPNGIARWIDLTFLANPQVQLAVVILFAIASVLYLIDRLSVLGLGVLTAILIAKGTLVNSQGAINHSLQLLTLVVLAQWIVQIFAWQKKWPGRDAQIYAVHWSKVVIVASYVSAGLAKIFATKGMWIVYSPNLAVQVIKSNLQAYYTDLEPMTVGFVARAPYWIVDHPYLARIVFGSGLILELVAFLALINRRWGFFIAIAMLGLHESIAYLMDIDFKNHVYLWAIYFINLPWLAFRFVQIIRSRFLPKPVAA